MLSSQMVQDSRGQHRAPGSEYCEKVRSVPPPPTFVAARFSSPRS